jgi:hypothetical protein
VTCENQETELGGPRIAGFTKHYWTFLLAENLYDIGLYIFVLLYSLYLLDLGFREDFLGWGYQRNERRGYRRLPSGGGHRKKAGTEANRGLRIGRRGHAVCFALGRTGRPWLIGTAFVAGAISSVWAVSVVPMVAALTNDRNRALGYSI